VCLLPGTDWVFMCFVWIWEQTAIISLYTYSINWLVFITETECVYCAVRTGSLCFVWIWEQTAIISLYSIIWLVFITEMRCVLLDTDWVSMCFVWIWEQTAIISLYSIIWLVFITETGCVYCAIRTGSLFVLRGSENKQRLFPYTTLTDWFYNRDGVFTARYGLSI
jgi:hypothetical protein